MKWRCEGLTAAALLAWLTDAQNNAAYNVVQMQFSFHDRRFCLGRRCLTAPVSRGSSYPRQTFFIRSLTAAEIFPFSNVHMIYMTHMQGKKCFLKNQFQCSAGNFERVQSGLRLCSTRRLSHVKEKKKNLEWWTKRPFYHPNRKAGRSAASRLHFPSERHPSSKGQGSEDSSKQFMQREVHKGVSQD